MNDRAGASPGLPTLAASAKKARACPGPSAPESALGRRGESPLEVNVTYSRLQLRRRKTAVGAADTVVATATAALREADWGRAD